MREHPIIFDAESIRAILDGRKTQTRRVMRPQPDPFEGGVHPNNTAVRPAPYLDAYCGEPKTRANPRGMSREWHWWTEDNRCGPHVARCPYGQPGDVLWVRETWRLWHPHGFPAPEFRADDFADDTLGPWKPSIHMPKGYARLWLRVTNVRAERLQDIGGDDIEAEGIPRSTDMEPDRTMDLLTRFRDRWGALNEKRGFGWDADPWVWVIEFRVSRGPLRVQLPKPVMIRDRLSAWIEGES